MHFSQSPIPESTFNLNIGLGQTYGGIGVKTLLDKNNSGLILGLGKFAPETLGYSIGAQVSKNAIYFNLNYGVLTMLSINNAPIVPKNGVSIMWGGMIGLGQEKRAFLDLAVGYGYAGQTYVYGKKN